MKFCIKQVEICCTLHKRQIKALIRLHGYEDRPTPLVFACTKVRLSRVEAHFNSSYCASGPLILCPGPLKAIKAHVPGTGMIDL